MPASWYVIGCENPPLPITWGGQSPVKPLYQAACWHWHISCLYLPSYPCVTGDNTGVLWGWLDHWVAMVVCWSVSAFCMLCCSVSTGGAVATTSDTVAWCGCSGMCLCSACYGGSKYWDGSFCADTWLSSQWPAIWNVFAQRPTSRASNIVNFRCNPYFRFVSSTYYTIMLL